MLVESPSRQTYGYVDVASSHSPSSIGGSGRQAAPTDATANVRALGSQFHCC